MTTFLCCRVYFRCRSVSEIVCQSGNFHDYQGISVIANLDESIHASPVLMNFGPVNGYADCKMKCAQNHSCGAFTYVPTLNAGTSVSSCYGTNGSHFEIDADASARSGVCDTGMYLAHVRSGCSM